MTIRNLEKDIVAVIKKAKNPISTREIALQVDRAWHTVLTACLRLQIKGQITGFTAGKMHLWMKKK